MNQKPLETKDKPQYPIVSDVEDGFKKDCKKMIFDISKDLIKVLNNGTTR